MSRHPQFPPKHTTDLASALFKSHFERFEDVRESFEWLHPIRVDTMHARPISQDEELLLYVEVKRIIDAIES